jgi:hypothetical protein
MIIAQAEPYTSDERYVYLCTKQKEGSVSGDMVRPCR